MPLASPAYTSALEQALVTAAKHQKWEQPKIRGQHHAFATLTTTGSTHQAANYTNAAEILGRT